jgi:hypothetical protein
MTQVTPRALVLTLLQKHIRRELRVKKRISEADSG